MWWPPNSTYPRQLMHSCPALVPMLSLLLFLLLLRKQAVAASVAGVNSVSTWAANSAVNLGLASVVFLSLVIKAANLNVAECSAGDYVGPSQSADVTRWVRAFLITYATSTLSI